MLAAQREAIRRTACETPDTRREHFVWPTGGRLGFYWFAVEAIASVHPEDFDRLPAVVECDGFARSAAAAHRTAERAFDDPCVARSLTRILHDWIEDHR